jgi:hypothetical protein
MCPRVRRGARDALAALAAVAALVLAGCPAHTDYGGAQRLTDHTAYTLEPGEVLTGVGLGGATVDNLLLSLRLEWSPYVDGLEIGTNLAHDAVSIINLYAKYNVLDTRWFGLGVRLGFKWLNPSNVWIVPDGSGLKEDLGAVDMYMFPASVMVSFPLAEWISIHTELNYMYTPVSGDLVLDDTHYNGGVAWHELALHPAVHLHLGAGTALLLGVQVPLYSAVSGDGYSETPDPNHPGIRYGLQASLSTRFAVTELVSPWIGLHVAWEHFNLRVTGTWGLRFFDESMLQADGWLAYVPIPGVELAWRF